jgi:hypothetical protein
MSDKKLIVDLARGTQTYVDLTPEEIEQRAVDAQAAARCSISSGVRST